MMKTAIVAALGLLPLGACLDQDLTESSDQDLTFDDNGLVLPSGYCTVRLEEISWIRLPFEDCTDGGVNGRRGYRPGLNRAVDQCIAGTKTLCEANGGTFTASGERHLGLDAIGVSEYGAWCMGTPQGSEQWTCTGQRPAPVPPEDPEPSQMPE